MIYYFSGLPGAGKTLSALELLLELMQDISRPVYVDGIPELSVSHETLPNPVRWYELPVGSIVLIDECQRIFPAQKLKGQSEDEILKSIAEMALNRHVGIDLILVSQHPKQIRPGVRYLVNRHTHLVRFKMGFSSKVLSRSRQGIFDPDVKKVQGIMEVTRPSKYYEKFYSLYKSSELHTQVKYVPIWRWFLFGGVILLFALIILPYAIYLFSTAEVLSDDAKNIIDQSKIDRVKEETGGSERQRAAPVSSSPSSVSHRSFVPFRRIAGQIADSVILESHGENFSIDISKCRPLKMLNSSVVSCGYSGYVWRLRRSVPFNSSSQSDSYTDTKDAGIFISGRE